MEVNNIKLVSIIELVENSFFIPSYQRGYRWTKQQVKDLLNDIIEFSPKEIPNSIEKTWYCLQPIVVKKRDGKWEVIDGQQRLTTIYLILKYLHKKTPFSLEYETRNTETSNSADFLETIESKTKEESDMNIDYFHIYQAYQTIKNWFDIKKNEFKVDFKFKVDFESKFTESVKVIWYETADTDSIDIFTRINMGKIPLTNAELIKALFLNSSNFKDADAEKLRLKQLEIASEWDRMEYSLQDDSFWYFINKEANNLATRIEFIFDLMAKKETIPDPYSTFRFFNEKFKGKIDDEISNNWQEIKKYYQTLEEWFNDRVLYHKIGYLITIGISLHAILNGKGSLTKTEYIKWLDNQIVNIVNKKPIAELEYGPDNAQLIKILLLHNICTTLKSEDISLRFPFNKYKDKKNGGWSLEHIHAQNSEHISEIDDFKEWLEAIDKNIITDEIKTKINEFNNDKQRDKIPQLLTEICNLFGEPDVHSIGNMALLSKNDNSKLNNGLFPVKRERVIELEKNNAFIPLATKKVFQKYFNCCTKQLSKWEEKDRNAYLCDILETLKEYLPQTKLAENE